MARQEYIYRIQITHKRGGACIWDAEHVATSKQGAINEAFRDAGIPAGERWRFCADAIIQ